MFWVSKGKISVVYRQSVLVFMLVLTICVEKTYFWFALLLYSSLSRLQFLEFSFGEMFLNYLPENLGEDMSGNMLTKQLRVQDFTMSETLLALLH